MNLLLFNAWEALEFLICHAELLCKLIGFLRFLRQRTHEIASRGDKYSTTFSRETFGNAQNTITFTKNLRDREPIFRDHSPPLK